MARPELRGLKPLFLIESSPNFGRWYIEQNEVISVSKAYTKAEENRENTLKGTCLVKFKIALVIPS